MEFVFQAKHDELVFEGSFAEYVAPRARLCFKGASVEREDIYEEIAGLFINFRNNVDSKRNGSVTRRNEYVGSR